MKTTTLTFHKKQNTLTTCLLLKITRRDGKVFRLNNYFEDVLFNNENYSFTQSFTLSAIEKTDTLAVDNAEITCILNTSNDLYEVSTSSVFTEADLKAGIWDEALFVLYEVNYENSNEFEVKFAGTTGEYQLFGDSFKLELRSSTQKYREKLTVQYTPICRATFCGEVCGLNQLNFTDTGIVERLHTKTSWFDSRLTRTNSTVVASITAISKATRAVITSANHNLNTTDKVLFSCIGAGEFSVLNGREYEIIRLTNNTFSIAFDSKDFTTNFINIDAKASLVELSEYYKYGTVKFKSGNNIGLSFEVIQYAPQYVEIFHGGRLIFEIKEGDEYEIVAGCDGLARTCEKFNNKINYDGEDLLPSAEDLASGT